MKNQTLKFLSFATFLTLTFLACTPDPCKDVNCGENGTCIEGTCSCLTGYEGETCEIETRSNYTGSWNAADQCSASGAASYLVSIVNGTTITDVNITNFWGSFDASVPATVSGNTITILRSEPDGDGFFVEGTGTLDGTTITWNYTITDETDPANINSDACTSTWTKQ